MKAIIIARVSTEEQREAGNSLPAQVIRLEKYCQNREFEIIKVCSFDESTYSNDRTDLRIENEKVPRDVQKPFDLIVNCSDRIVWRPLVDTFRNNNVVFGVTLQSVQTAFTTFGIQHPMPMV